jgi:transporter family-2 protein
MQKSIIIAMLVAAGSGLAVGVQSSLINVAGKISGATLTGLLVNFLGGAAAGIFLSVIYFRQGSTSFSDVQMSTIGLAGAAGILGIGVIMGIAYSLPKVGVAAGLSAIIAGQMVVGVIVDTFGLVGGEPIPLSWSRVAGITLLALGTWAILPKE